MFLVQLLFRIDIPESKTEKSYEVSSLLLKTNDLNEAYNIAHEHGNHQNCTFVNHSSDTVNWKFLGIIELMEVSENEKLLQFDSTLYVNPSDYKYDKWQSRIQNFVSMKQETKH